MSSSASWVGQKRGRDGSPASDAGPQSALAAGLQDMRRPQWHRDGSHASREQRISAAVKTLVDRDVLPAASEHYITEHALQSSTVADAVQSALSGQVQPLQRVLSSTLPASEHRHGHTQLAHHLIQGLHKDMLQEGTPTHGPVGAHVLPPALDGSGGGPGTSLNSASSSDIGPRGSPVWSVPPTRADRLASLGSVSELLSAGGSVGGLLGPSALASMQPGSDAGARHGPSGGGRSRLDSIASVASSLASGGELPGMGGRARGLSIFDSGAAPTSDENATALALLNMPRAATPESRAHRTRHDSISLELAHVPPRASFDSAYGDFSTGRGDGFSSWGGPVSAGLPVGAATAVHHGSFSGTPNFGSAPAPDTIAGRTRRASTASTGWYAAGHHDTRGRLGSMASLGGLDDGLHTRDRRFSVSASAGPGVWSGLDALGTGHVSAATTHTSNATSSAVTGAASSFSYQHERASETEVQQRVQQRMSASHEPSIVTRSSRARAPARAAMHGAEAYAAAPTKFHTAVPTRPATVSAAPTSTAVHSAPARQVQATTPASRGSAAAAPGGDETSPASSSAAPATEGRRRTSTRTRAAAAAARAVSAAAAAVDEEADAYDYDYDFSKAKKPKNWTKLAASRRRDGWVGAYTPAQRRKRLERWHAKRMARVWAKKVKYGVRKNFADSRLRVKGRFVKKEDEAALRDWIQMM